MRVAFHAPLKSPDHPIPSGDREMGRLLIKALRRAGHDVVVASTLRGFFATPDRQALAEHEAQASAEVARLTALWRDARADRPDVWFTYHPYYKAPDLVGPAVARALAIPYVTAEASYAGKRQRDEWGPWQRRLAEGLLSGDVHFCFTADDAVGLADLLGSPDKLIDLPPFVDAEPLPASGRPRTGGPVALVTVAMMRPGVKQRSYAFLAQALSRLADLDWRLTIIGDGPSRDDVARAFAAIAPDRVAWRGTLAQEAVSAQLAAADLYLWPGFGEAYGMAYLEAQAAGLPVIALDSGGVATTLRSGETGLLVPEGDLDAYANAVRSLISDAGRRHRMSAAAQKFVRDARSVARAAVILDRGLAAAVAARSAREKRAALP